MDWVPGTDYKILQSEDHFKFGVDSVLLSSFAKMKEGKVLADLGTGVGVLALRCHYFYKPIQVYAFEIQKDLADLAKKSVEINGLEDEIKVLNRDIKDGFDSQLDYIITNPPYIEKGRGRPNNNPAKLIAFHEIYMDLDDVFSFAYKYLKDKGRLFMVNRADRLVDVIEKAREYRMEPSRSRMVHSFKSNKCHLFLMEFIKDAGKNFIIEKPLIIYEEDLSYTKEVWEMYYG